MGRNYPMGYMSAQQAASILRVPVNYLEKLGIIEGYHIDTVKNYIYDNDLPIDDFREVILITDDVIEGFICCTTLEEALIRVSKFTWALIMSEPNERVWTCLRTVTKVFVFGHETSFAHMTFQSCEEVIAFCQKEN